MKERWGKNRQKRNFATHIFNSANDLFNFGRPIFENIPSLGSSREKKIAKPVKQSIIKSIKNFGSDLFSTSFWYMSNKQINLNFPFSAKLQLKGLLNDYASRADFKEIKGRTEDNMDLLKSDLNDFKADMDQLKVERKLRGKTFPKYKVNKLGILSRKINKYNLKIKELKNSKVLSYDDLFLNAS